MKKMAIGLAIGIPISACSATYISKLTDELERNTRSKFEKVILEIGGLGIATGMGYAIGEVIWGWINLVAKN